MIKSVALVLSFMMVAAAEPNRAYFTNVRDVRIAEAQRQNWFAVDEELDRSVINALRTRDNAFLASLDPRRLKAGSSEIRNWLVVARAAADLDLSWVSYTPAYRTPALTGTGLCFARWS